MADASPAHEVDSEFYQPASRFFPAHSRTALTYDDVTLATLYTEILPKESQIDTRLADGLHLNIPLVSADMDTVTEADMAITAFPGDVGGDLANLNRWRGQIGLPAVGQAEFDRETQHLDRNGLHMTVVDIVGTGANAQRILGAMVPHQGATWFFKLSGPDALVAGQKKAFLALLDTIKPAAPAK